MAWAARVGLARRDQGASIEPGVGSPARSTQRRARPQPPPALRVPGGAGRSALLALLRGEPTPAFVAPPSSSPRGARNATHALFQQPASRRAGRSPRSRSSPPRSGSSRPSRPRALAPRAPRPCRPPCGRPSLGASPSRSKSSSVSARRARRSPIRARAAPRARGGGLRPLACRSPRGGACGCNCSSGSAMPEVARSTSTAVPPGRVRAPRQAPRSPLTSAPHGARTLPTG